MIRLRPAVLALCLAVSASAFGAEPLDEARAAHSRGDHLRAIALLVPLANAGNPEAQTRLGLMYFRGQGVREDDDAAFAWMRKAAVQGHAQAQYHLASFYAFGYGPPVDDEERDRMAARWYFESAQQGNADAQYVLGLLFLSGKGVVRSEDEARKWFARAANGGHADAQRFLSEFTPGR